MNTYTTIMIIINIIMLFSVWFTHHKFYILELFAYWMFICAVIQQVFTILTINLHFIGITEGLGVFWSLLINRLILYPSLIIWLIYFSKDQTLVHKTVLTGIWLVLLALIQLLSNHFGLISFTKWNFFFSLLEWIVVILTFFSFKGWFRYLLKKEDLIV